MPGTDPSPPARAGAAPGKTGASGLVLHDSRGRRITAANAATFRSLRFVLERERAGSWAEVMKSTGRACGRGVAAGQDALLLKAGRPILATQPLEASVAFLRSQFAEYGWGVLSTDVSAASNHGLIIARLGESFFAGALAEPGGRADPFAAGVLLGFFEYITGQILAAEEIACVREGAPQSTIAVSTPDRLAAIGSALGTASAEEIIARLKTLV